MKIPTYLTAEDHARVSAAVAKAETETAGEIVTIIADRSDGYTDVALAWAALGTFAALAVLAVAPDFYLGLYDRLTGGWVQQWTPGQIFAVALVVAMLKFAGIVLVQLWQPLKFLLVLPPIRTARVHERAVRAFRIGAERRTHGRTGILIYLSMRERRAEIVADEAIATKVDPDVWGDAMVALLAEMRQGRVADGMIAAVENVGEILAGHFPAAHDDQNELPDRLIEV
jgi:putative membrane protein